MPVSAIMPSSMTMHPYPRAGSSQEPVRDHERGTVHHQVRKRPLHQHFRLGIELGGGLIQDQDGRILQDRPGDGDGKAAAARR